MSTLTRTLPVVTLLAAFFSCPVSAQIPSLELKTSRGFIYSTGNDGLQPFVITVGNPTDEDLRDVSFTITMPAGVVLGSVDSECQQSTASGIKTLDCAVDFVGPHNIVVLDFFVDGPLSSAPDNLITMELQSNLTTVEQSEFERSLADGDRTLVGSSLSIPLVRDLHFDGNDNSIPDLDEGLLQPDAGQSVEEVLAEIAVLDVLFLVSTTAENYLQAQRDPRIAQLVTSTNQVLRDNNILIRINSLGTENIDYVANEDLSETLTKMQTATDAAFAELQSKVDHSGADLVVLLHALPPGADEFCGFASNVAIGRQGDFTSELHRGQLLSVLDVGPDCIDVPDLAASLAANMGIVPSRIANPDGGTFSYSAGYGITDSFKTISTRIGNQDFGAAADVNRFSDPDYLCMNMSCGVDESDIAQGVNAALSLNQTRHLVNALNNSGSVVSTPDKPTITFNNGEDLQVTHSAVETGALVGAFTEFSIEVTNNGTETLHDINLTAIHLDNGVLDFSAGVYRADSSQCFISGATLNTEQSMVDSLIQKAGRLNCYFDTIAPGEIINLGYFLEVDTQVPALDEDNHYLHEIIALNGVLQEESAHCIPIYTDLVDATVPSNVCDTVDQLAIATETGTGFLDLEALPTITGNIINVPWIRLDDGSFISAQFRVINFGVPELELLSYQSIEADLNPALESFFSDISNRLTINGISLAEAAYNLVFIMEIGTDPVRFGQMQLIEIESGGS